ncbi:hypothetical protein BMR1_02g03200 [Babesia microti strain RI]|uniref:Uncharacterized protein n=1 Tax=Babesia microti (strain RI) TaxID=1133968 RepID=I7I8W4_BABMR|nr:hypothetical protein BMR1_02g03200 [Babesia microti strain RI]CCF73793.1 hypothetical protein BMR1_02g03200 [Babesia microti strain RI]|eukprot:XP_012648402.1 hypothetical protein BMR1_02g03200 [Babesia microti strain RI]
MPLAVAGTAVNIPRVLDHSQQQNVPAQNPFIIVASLICFMGVHNKSPEITIIGIICMLEIYLSLDYGQFNFSNLSPLFGLIPMFASGYTTPIPPNTGGKIIVEKVET